MNHLTNEQIYDLAKKAENNIPFTEQNMDMIMHIGECESCCRLMKCMMSVILVTDHMEQAVEKATPEYQRISAKIRLIADRNHAALNQFCKPGMKWAFVPAVTIDNQPDKDDGVQKQRIEDIDNSQTFVEYEPEACLLTIQLDGRDSDASTGFLRFEDGTMRKIAFEKMGDLFCAQVRDIKNGEYYIILERYNVMENRAEEELTRSETDRIRDMDSMKNTLFDK